MTTENFDDSSSSSTTTGLVNVLFGPLIATFTGLAFVVARNVPLLETSIMVSNCVAGLLMVIFSMTRGDRLLAKVDGSAVAYTLTIGAMAVIVSVLVHMTAIGLGF